jgi:hypothetical protein
LMAKTGLGRSIKMARLILIDECTRDILFCIERKGGVSVGDDEISESLLLDREKIVEDLLCLKNAGIVATEKYVWVNPKLGTRTEATLTPYGRTLVEKMEAKGGDENGRQ